MLLLEAVLSSSLAGKAELPSLNTRSSVGSSLQIDISSLINTTFIPIQRSSYFAAALVHQQPANDKKYVAVLSSAINDSGCYTNKNVFWWTC